MPRQAAQSGQAVPSIPALPSEDLFALKRFAPALSPNSDNPFNETLALDATSAALINRGFVRDEQNPDFLVMAKYNSNSSAVVSRGSVPGFFGGYAPRPAYHGGGIGISYAPGYCASSASQLELTLFFIKPQPQVPTAQTKAALLQKKSQENSKETHLGQTLSKHNLPPGATHIFTPNILWQGQGNMVSSRNIFTSLACLAAGIVQEFPQSVRLNEKKIELQQCPNIQEVNLAPSEMR